MSKNRITEQKGYTFLVKAALISMLVSGVGTGSAFASGETAPVPSSTVITEVSAEVAVSESKEKTSSLLPGDFFYFIKIVYENIRLSMTIDDVKEARLLADFAQERLSESSALHAKGETERSEQVLQKSLENQQHAIEIVASEAEEQHGDKDLKQAVEVKSDLQHNIIALTAALEKVRNPQAQESLLKNIIKSFGHLEKKLAKLENKAQEEQASVPSAAQAADPADAKTDSVVVISDAIITSSIETETEQKTVSDKKTKPEKEVKTEKTAKTGKEANKQKKEHEKNQEAIGKNHNGK